MSKSEEENVKLINDSDYFVQIPRSALALGSEKKLTVEEINLFAWLQTMVSWSFFLKEVFFIECHVNSLVKILNLNTNNLSKEKKRVMKNLKSLEKKGYLSYVETDYQTLEINLLLEQQEVYSKPKFARKEMSYIGFSKIPFTFMKRLESKYDITILALVIWREGLDGYQITRQEWAETLEVTEKTAIKVINECSTVETTVGKYISKNRQEANTYKTIANVEEPFNIEEEKNAFNEEIAEKSKKETPQNNKKTALDHMFSHISDQNVINDYELFKKLVDKKNTRLDSEAYLVYLETDDEVLKEYAERKFDKMKNSENEYCREALEKIIRGAYDMKRNAEIKKDEQTFGTRSYFINERKIYGTVYQGGQITSEEYEDRAKYLDTQIRKLDEGNEVQKYEEWSKFNSECNDTNEQPDIEETLIEKSGMRESENANTDSKKGGENYIQDHLNKEELIDNMLKQISDSKVKHDRGLFLEIQDLNVEMGQHAYEIIRTTSDGKLREYGFKKIETMKSEKIKELDDAYRKKYKNAV